MPGVTARELDANLVGRNVKFVVNDNDVFGGDVEELGEVGDWTARGVHETQGLGENHSRLPEFGFGHCRICFVALEVCALALCQNVQDHLADVVAVARVGRARVAQPDDEHLERRYGSMAVDVLRHAQACGLKPYGISFHVGSQQTRLGPSEIGDPCARRLAYKLLGTQKARTLSTPWRPTVGTAVHSWIEEALTAHNERQREAIGGTRWLLETRIDAGPMAGGSLTGHSDCYDRVTCTAIDWKIIGPSAHKTLKANLAARRGPRTEYKVQLHTYGLGYVRRGLPVERVMLVALPSAGELDDALMWSEPWNRSIAETAMARVDRIHALTSTLGPVALTITDQQLHDAGLTALCGDPGSAAAGFAGERLALPLDEVARPAVAGPVTEVVGCGKTVTVTTVVALPPPESVTVSVTGATILTGGPGSGTAAYGIFAQSVGGGGGDGGAGVGCGIHAGSFKGSRAARSASGGRARMTSATRDASAASPFCSAAAAAANASGSTRSHAPAASSKTNTACRLTSLTKMRPLSSLTLASTVSTPSSGCASCAATGTRAWTTAARAGSRGRHSARRARRVRAR